MTTLITANQVRQTEERAGRHPNPAPRLPKSDHHARISCGNPLIAGNCPVCRQTHRTLQGFAHARTASQTYYAACGNCGHWEQI